MNKGNFKPFSAEEERIGKLIKNGIKQIIL